MTKKEVSKVKKVLKKVKDYYMAKWEPECEYKEHCKSKGFRCDNCKNNLKAMDCYAPIHSIYP